MDTSIRCNQTFLAFNSSRLPKAIIQVVGLISIGLIYLCICMWGAREVRENFNETIMLTIAGGICLLISSRMFSWLGISIENDAIARRNPAATVTLCGALLSVAVIFAAGNLGEGPSYWENVFSVALGFAAFFCLWLILECSTKISVSVTEERDPAAGMRIAGFFIAISSIIGRAIAGDWHSTTATVLDFIHDAWPVIILCFIAASMEFKLRPNREKPFPDWKSAGLFPLLIYLALAGAWLFHLGRWEGMPE